MAKRRRPVSSARRARSSGGGSGLWIALGVVGAVILGGGALLLQDEGGGPGAAGQDRTGAPAPTGQDSSGTGERDAWIEGRAQEIVDADPAVQQVRRAGANVRDEVMAVRLEAARAQAARERDALERLARIANEVGAGQAVVERVWIRIAPTMIGEVRYTDDQLRQQLEGELRLGPR